MRDSTNINVDQFINTRIAILDRKNSSNMKELPIFLKFSQWFKDQFELSLNRSVEHWEELFLFWQNNNIKPKHKNMRRSTNNNSKGTPSTIQRGRRSTPKSKVCQEDAAAPCSNTNVKLYTDGSCFVNPGVGGYAAILIQDGKETVLSQGFRLTTNNRMEIMAILEGLKSLPVACNVTVYSDSQYCVQSINTWIYGWQKKNWKKSGDPLKNVDLWKEMYPLLKKHKVLAKWVKGHNGHPLNERCDRLAKEACNARRLLTDVGYA